MCYKLFIEFSLFVFVISIDKSSNILAIQYVNSGLINCYNYLGIVNIGFNTVEPVYIKNGNKNIQVIDS